MHTRCIRVMAHSRAVRTAARRRRGRPARIASVWRITRSGRRALMALLAAPLAVRILVGAVAVLAVWSAANWLYQVVRKPTELFFPVSGVLAKAPPETWRQYGPLFRRHSTVVITPELLAALAQVEGAGNRVARRFCVRDHVVVEDGVWHDVRSCWFNGLYTRVVPGHAVELTAALLDRGVAQTLERHRIATATLGQKQDLAAVIHLCGAGPGDAYARRGFRLTAGQRCGDHDVGRYVAHVNARKREFARLAAVD